MNIYIKILDLSEVLQGITIANISGFLNLKSRHSFGKGEVFSQDIASKPGLNEFLHQNLGFE